MRGFFGNARGGILQHRPVTVPVQVERNMALSA